MSHRIGGGGIGYLPLMHQMEILVGAEANHSVRDIVYREPTASEKAVTETIATEVGRIEAKMSVMLAHIEGHYESQVENLKLKIKAQKYALPLLISALLSGVLIGFGLGRFV